MKIMKRLLVPFILLGLALLPSGIAAAGLGDAVETVSDASVSAPAHGKHHWHGKRLHHHDGPEAEQEAEDNDKQESNQANIIDDGDSLIDIEEVIPIAANIPVIPINNVLNIIQLVNTIIEIPILSYLDVIPINLCAVIPVVTGEDVEEAECEFPHDIGGDKKEQEGISQLRHMEAHAGNDETNQSNEAEQEQESEQEQEQGQVNVGRGHSSHGTPAQTSSTGGFQGDSVSPTDALPATGEELSSLQTDSTESLQTDSLQTDSLPVSEELRAVK